MLFLLDEFAALGRLEPVARAMELMAGYGLQHWPILQDMDQLKRPTTARMQGRSGVIQAFEINDHATADMRSRTLGDTTLEYDTVSTSQAIGWGNNTSDPH
ncbi:TraM recognition domain-containing protein [Sphingomonas faeni]